MSRITSPCITLRVQVPNNQVLGMRVIVVIVQVLGQYVTIEDLDPYTTSESRAPECYQFRDPCCRQDFAGLRMYSRSQVIWAQALTTLQPQTLKQNS